jgi:hypothetical protein
MRARWQAGMWREAGAGFGNGGIGRIGSGGSGESRTRLLHLGVRGDIIQQLLDIYLAACHVLTGTGAWDRRFGSGLGETGLREGCGCGCGFSFNGFRVGRNGEGLGRLGVWATGRRVGSKRATRQIAGRVLNILSRQVLTI